MICVHLLAGKRPRFNLEYQILFTLKYLKFKENEKWEKDVIGGNSVPILPPKKNLIYSTQAH